MTFSDIFLAIQKHNFKSQIAQKGGSPQDRLSCKKKYIQNVQIP